MAELSWQEAIEIIEPHVVKIDTPRGSGTGFLFAYAESKLLCGIATAAHVVAESDRWQEPIRIQHFISKEEKLLKEKDRIIRLDLKLDTAVILFAKNKIPFPENTLTFVPKGKRLKVGNEIGWVGFPSVSPKNLCFFSGKISSWLEESKIYLVDGVAINGVSGGPTFYIDAKGIKLIGSVSAYLPNRVGATPGLSIISSVGHFQAVIKTIKDLDEAKKKKKSLIELKVEKQDKTNNA